MSFRSCQCTRLDDGISPVLLWDGPKGTFSWGTQINGDWKGRELHITMPYDRLNEHCSSVHSIRVHRPSESQPPHPSWLWDGDEDYPTLSPSIACGLPKGSNWHGYLVNGRLASESDVTEEEQKAIKRVGE